MCGWLHRIRTENADVVSHGIPLSRSIDASIHVPQAEGGNGLLKV